MRNPLEKTTKAYDMIASWRDITLRPLSSILTKMKVTADMISYLSVASMAGFAILAGKNTNAAILFIAIAILLDNIDGVVARYQKKDSDRGKLIDVCCDQITFSLFIIGMVYAGLLNGLTGIIYLCIMFLSKTFRAIFHSFYLKTDWHFKPVVGFTPTLIAAMSYAAYGVWYFTGLNLLNATSIIFSIILFIDWISHYNSVIYMKT
jgi:phosphatidylglycerophosphate synthase